MKCENIKKVISIDELEVSFSQASLGTNEEATDNVEVEELDGLHTIEEEATDDVEVKDMEESGDMEVVAVAGPAKRGRPTKAEPALIREKESNPLYCYCNSVENSGIMVGCDNEMCKLQWFHIECLGEGFVVPTGEWFCAECV